MCMCVCPYMCACVGGWVLCVRCSVYVSVCLRVCVGVCGSVLCVWYVCGVVRVCNVWCVRAKVSEHCLSELFYRVKCLWVAKEFGAGKWLGVISVSREVGFIGLYKVGKLWGVARIGVYECTKL